MRTFAKWAVGIMTATLAVLGFSAAAASASTTTDRTSATVSAVVSVSATAVAEHSRDDTQCSDCGHHVWRGGERGSNRCDDGWDG